MDDAAAAARLRGTRRVARGNRCVRERRLDAPQLKVPLRRRVSATTAGRRAGGRGWREGERESLGECRSRSHRPVGSNTPVPQGEGVSLCCRRKGGCGPSGAVGGGQHCRAIEAQARACAARGGEVQRLCHTPGRRRRERRRSERHAITLDTVSSPVRVWLRGREVAHPTTGMFLGPQAGSCSWSLGAPLAVRRAGLRLWQVSSSPELAEPRRVR